MQRAYALAELMPLTLRRLHVISMKSSLQACCTRLWPYTHTKVVKAATASGTVSIMEHGQELSSQTPELLSAGGLPASSMRTCI